MLEAGELAGRPPAPDPRAGETGYGRELFAHMRAMAQPAERGAGVFFGR
jgi:hypothetical protein